MQTHKTRLVVWIAGLILIGGCQEGGEKEATTAATKRIAVARGQLENIMTAARASGDSAYAEYMSQHAQRGLGILKGGRAPKTATLLSATITMGPRGTGMLLWFFDPCFDVTGIAVETASGDIRTYPGLFTWDPEARKWYSETILRDQGISIELVDNEGKIVRVPYSNPHLPRLKWPKDFVEHPLRVRLLTHRGVSDDSVETHVRRFESVGFASTTASDQ